MKIEMPPSTMLNPVPVVMVSCAGKDPEKIAKRPNIITCAWAGTVNSEPPMVSVSIRKSRHSHELICETQEFVINLVSEDLAKACDYSGVRSGSKEDKFEKLDLHAAVAPKLIYAPMIEEAPVSLSCKLKDIIELGSHDMFLAEVVGVSVDEKLLNSNGKICLEKAHLVTYCHGDYFTIGKMLGFFGYSVASKEALKRRMPAKKAKKSNKKGNK
ncbi:MAG: flavin reductase family protein [Clostridiales bacterium]|nr:flavin reductase family protein [Clostridiales bacterium]